MTLGEKLAAEFDAWFAQLQALTSKPLDPEAWTGRWYDRFTPVEALREGPENDEDAPVKDIEVAELVEKYRNDKRTFVPDNEVMSLLDIIEQQAAALSLALSQRGAGDAISLTDPAVIIAGIRQFGLAPDGSDLRDLERAIDRLAVAPATPAGDDVERARKGYPAGVDSAGGPAPAR